MDAMADPIQLYMAPGTCARVPMIALEEAGESFETVVIRFLRGEHKSPAYRKLNPKGKVPTLVIDGAVLTENVAILTYLAARYPSASLLPHAESLLDRTTQLADLSYCASTLHPIVTRIRLPQFFAGSDAAFDVWQNACEAMKEPFAMIEARLGSRPWWYGDRWSVLDGYIYWIYWRVAGAGFDVAPYPKYGDHAARMEQRPAVRRALDRETVAQATLEKEGAAFVPPPPPKPR
jgi:glutathione S-transferase